MMEDTNPERGFIRSVERREAMVLKSFSPSKVRAQTDRPRVTERFVVGRHEECDYRLDGDDKLSKKHFAIEKVEGQYVVEDLGSTNGTFVDGYEIRTKKVLNEHEPSVIKAGRSIFVLHCPGGGVANLSEAFYPQNYGLSGRFFSSSIIDEIKEVAESDRTLLITGPTGVGKEVAVQAYAVMRGGSKGALRVLDHNMARFCSREEIQTTLFGVASRFYSGVDERAGLIEKANGGILYLDEIHNAPLEVQRSLLRVIETGRVSRFGETQNQRVITILVFSSNSPPPDFGIVNDLRARLRVVRIPSLKERIADLPSIFHALLEQGLKKRNLPKDLFNDALETEHFEMMCVDGFEDINVRGLLDIVDRLVTKYLVSGDERETVDEVYRRYFSERANREGSSIYELIANRFEEPSETKKGQGDTGENNQSDLERQSHYEDNKREIIAVFIRERRNIAATVRELRRRKFMCSERWLSSYVKKWGVK